MSNYPKYPLYIPSKGRSDVCLTSDALCEMRVKHYIVVEPDQVADYKNRRNTDFATILTLDMDYKEKYEHCDNLGTSKSSGPGPARNFAWDHSIKNGHDWHWVMDDNIRYFVRTNNRRRIKCKSPSFWRAQEDFITRYENVGMGGPVYSMFCFRDPEIDMPPFITNTRIYSCNFIRNDLPFRWRGRYNEDTILSLDMMKAGWCTIQFYAFAQDKLMTQVLKGGNSEEFYFKEGTLEKSRMQVQVHPDVSKLVKKFGRWHHKVNYAKFAKMKLRRKPDLHIESTGNNYGQKLVKKADTA